MSSRWYPVFNRGNPQLRIFLPNLWMKLVKQEIATPSNKVTFHVSTEMTRLDVKNYLEKIYKIPVLDVHTKIVTGFTKYYPYNKKTDELYKEDDIKYAFVTLPKDVTFEFPDILKAEENDDKSEMEKAKKQVDQAKAEFKKSAGIVGGRRPGTPTFFGL